MTRELVQVDVDESGNPIWEHVDVTDCTCGVAWGESEGPCVCEPREDEYDGDFGAGMGLMFEPRPESPAQESHHADAAE